MHGSVIDTPYSSVRQILRDRLIPRLQVAFEHQSDDRAIAVENLRDAVLRHQGLQARILVGVAVAAVDHDGRRQIRPRSSSPLRDARCSPRRS